MDLDIRLKFNLELANIFEEKPQVLNFLLNHERRELCLNNLTKEIKDNPWLSKKQYQDIIKAGAHVFAKAALESREKELMTAAALKQAETNADMEKRVQEASEDIMKEANTTTLHSYANEVCK